MKAIVVDDERRARSLLRWAVKWEEAGIDTVFESASADEAVQIIQREWPEIIFTDMRMSNGDGVSLLDWLSRHPYPHKAIVVSGYDDFHYLQKTIQYGGFDYLIKPVNEMKVNETLKRAVQEWIREDENRRRTLEAEQRMREARPLYWDHLMTQSMNQGCVTAETSRKLTEEFGFPPELEVRFLIVSIDVNASDIREKFRERMDLFYFSLANVIGEVLKKSSPSMAFRYLMLPGTFGVISADHRRLSAVCEELHDAVRRTLRLEAAIHISDRGRFPSMLPELFRQALHIRQFKNLRVPRARPVYRSEDVSASPILSLAEDDSRLRALLISGDREQIAAYVDRLFEAEGVRGGLHPGMIEHWENELKLLGQQLLEQPGDMSLLSCGRDGAFSEEILRRELLGRLLLLAEGWQARHSTEKKKLVYEVRDYLQTRYMEPISPQALQKRFYVSADYLSRLFKQEFQVGIRDYVIGLRMDQAKMLLKNPNLKIARIAEMVGFEDEKYFSKVFKKCTGLTPNEYRKRFADGRNA